MRNLLFFITSLLILSTLAVGAYFAVTSELDYLKLSAPSVDNISVYRREIYTKVYGADNLLMYEYYYQKSRTLPADYDMKYLSAMVETLLESFRKERKESHIEYWKTYLMGKQGIDPYSLRGFLLNYYADNLITDDKLSGFRAEVVRFYTLQKLYDKYSDDKLYKMFLDTRAYGDNIYGIAAASRHFFGKDIKDSSLFEQAFLVSILFSGSAEPLNIKSNYQMIDRYARVLLKSLHDKGLIDIAYYNEQKNLNAKLIPHDKILVEPSYVDAAIRLVKADGRFQEGKKSIEIYTGYNKEATDEAKKVVSQYLSDKYKNLQMSFVLVNRKTQAVEVAIGSRLDNSTNNRAISLKRQTASTFKPIVYLTAFANGYKPSDIVFDKRYEFKSGPFMYHPNNYEDIYMGRIPLRSGLVYSLNNTTIKLAEDVGLKKVSDMAIKLGMQNDIRPFHAMALGAFPTTALNVAQMYSTIANLGVRKLPSIVSRVVQDEISYNMLEEPREVVSPVAAFQTLYIMQSVTKIGTAKNARLIEGTAAKTGTSDKYRDAWTVAIFGDYVAVCWAGFDSYESMGDKDAGGSMAAPAIAEFQRDYFGNVTQFEIEPPENIIFENVNPNNGHIIKGTQKGTYVEAFDKDNLPQIDEVKEKPSKKDKKTKADAKNKKETSKKK